MCVNTGTISLNPEESIFVCPALYLAFPTCINFFWWEEQTSIQQTKVDELMSLITLTRAWPVPLNKKCLCLATVNCLQKLEDGSSWTLLPLQLSTVYKSTGGREPLPHPIISADCFLQWSTAYHPSASLFQVVPWDLDRMYRCTYHLDWAFRNTSTDWVSAVTETSVTKDDSCTDGWAETQIFRRQLGRYISPSSLPESLWFPQTRAFDRVYRTSHQFPLVRSMNPIRKWLVVLVTVSPMGTSGLMCWYCTPRIPSQVGPLVTIFPQAARIVPSRTMKASLEGGGPVQSNIDFSVSFHQSMWYVMSLASICIRAL